MSSPRRKIVIRMVARDLSDSEALIQKVADTFPDDDIEIDASSETQATSAPDPEALSNAQNTLDIQHQAYQQGMDEAPSQEEATNRVLNIAGKVLQAGGKLTARVLATEAIKAELGKVTERLKDLM
ncbi:MAG: hypothetical protein AAGI44_05930 [Pseudomonadota bacterium]